LDAQWIHGLAKKREYDEQGVAGDSERHCPRRKIVSSSLLRDPTIVTGSKYESELPFDLTVIPTGVDEVESMEESADV